MIFRREMIKNQKNGRAIEMRIGFIGLGAMGRPMVKNLLAAGHEVTVWDISQDAINALVSDGAKAGESTADLAGKCEIIITMLPADPHVKGTLMNEQFAAALKPGTKLIDMSSCTTDAIHQVEKFYDGKDIDVVDAPVSGGVEGAQKGTLSIFAAGSEAALDAVMTVLEVLGKQIFRLGACGMGKAFKNLNNLLSTANTVLVAEMYHVAKKHGFDTDKLYDMVCASSGMSASFKNRFKRMVDGNFDNGFKLSLARKDVGNALALGEGVPMPVSKLVYELLLANSQYDNLDMAVMCKLFE